MNRDFKPVKDYDFTLPKTEKYTKPCPPEAEIDADIAEMKKLMSKNVGALRKMEKMERALVRLREIEEKYKDCNFTTQKHYWVWNAVTNSIIITEKAIARKESLGSHYIVK